MARNINDRLTRLKSRRRGTDRLGRVAFAEQQVLVSKSVGDEAWQKRGSGAQPYTRYALGAMQEVGPDYTRVGIETAERVGRQLSEGLKSHGHIIELRLQGSVPLNVHIRGASDVDLLTLDTDVFCYAVAGSRAQAGLYTSCAPRTVLGTLQSIRSASEGILRAQYPAATVDCSGGKAISISGGSLARPVDVVPSAWWDTVAYQASLQEHDRGVKILNKKGPVTIENLPFLHIKKISDRDLAAAGGLKKGIRLCKNVKNDAEEEGTSITLPSFDIAATMYHADMPALRMGQFYELSILGETQRHLDYLTTNEEEAKKLWVPDGSRKIFDTPDKLRGLRMLSLEMDDLMKEVAKEQHSGPQPPSTLQDSRSVIAQTYIPAA